MSEKIVVPVLGESITEATVSKWLKNEGESVEIDEPIVELETDKVNLEVPSPISGVLSEINSKDGTVVEVGALLGSVSKNGADAVKKKEINKLIGKINQEGLTIIPTKMYFFKGKVKIDLAVAKGKKLFDKRQVKKNRDWNRDKARIFSKNN